MNANKTTPRYEAVQGDYIGTTDNRRDRWYMQEIGGVADRQGAGYATQAEALDAIGMEEANEAASVCVQSWFRSRREGGRASSRPDQ